LAAQLRGFGPFPRVFPNFFVLLRLFLALFDVILTMFKIRLSFIIILEYIKDVILPQLEPEHINAGVIRVVLLHGPPWACCSENRFYQAAVIAFSAVQDVIRQLLGH